MTNILLVAIVVCLYSLDYKLAMIIKELKKANHAPE